MCWLLPALQVLFSEAIVCFKIRFHHISTSVCACTSVCFRLCLVVLVWWWHSACISLRGWALTSVVAAIESLDWAATALVPRPPSSLEPGSSTLPPSDLLPPGSPGRRRWHLPHLASQQPPEASPDSHWHSLGHQNALLPTRHPQIRQPLHLYLRQSNSSISSVNGLTQRRHYGEEHSNNKG